jgi:hypothetical protein
VTRVSVDGRAINFDLTRVIGVGAAIILSGVAATALTIALLLPTKSPDWLRNLMLLRNGDETAATPWVRWGLVVIAVILILLPRLWGRAVWPDVALALLIAVSVYAAYKQHERADKPTVAVVPATVTFTLPMGTLTAGSVGEGAQAVVVFVGPDKVVDGKVVSYASHRYSGTRVACSGGNGICVSIDRGSKDASTTAFLADREAAVKTYVLSGAK